ncbi:hypothetical protein [Lacinutrix cladophorae]
MKKVIFFFSLILIMGIQNSRGQNVQFQIHEQSHGWLNWQSGGDNLIGKQDDKRIEAIKVKLVDFPAGASIIYRAHVQGIGWQNWVSNGQVAGTTGQSRRLEAIEIKLQNSPSNYSICYTLDVGERESSSLPFLYPGGISKGCDGQLAGTVGRRRPVWRIGMKILDKNNIDKKPTKKISGENIYTVTKNGTSLIVKFNKTFLLRIHTGDTYIPYWEGSTNKGDTFQIKKGQWCEIKLKGKWSFMTDANNNQ